MQVCFDTPLPRLSLIVLPLRLFLLRCIAGQTCNSTTNRTTKPISDALAEVVDLSSSFLLLALLVLLNTLLLEALGTDKTAERFFGGAHVLVP